MFDAFISFLEAASIFLAFLLALFGPGCAAVPAAKVEQFWANPAPVSASSVIPTATADYSDAAVAALVAVIVLVTMAVIWRMLRQNGGSGGPT